MKIIVAICLIVVLGSCKVKPPQSTNTNNASGQESSAFQSWINGTTITSSSEEIKQDTSPREDQLKELRPVK